MIKISAQLEVDTLNGLPLVLEKTYDTMVTTKMVTQVLQMAFDVQTTKDRNRQVIIQDI